VKAEIRLYDYLLAEEEPVQEDQEAMPTDDFLSQINPNSLIVLADCRVEPGLSTAPIGAKYQFLRQGYFSVDLDSKPGQPVFNRIVSLKDSWAKIQKV